MTRRTMNCRLPVELIRHILTYLCDDVDENSDDVKRSDEKSSSLRSICLASHAFCQMAAPKLYNTVVLRNSRQAHTFLASSALDGGGRGLRLHMSYLWCGIVAEVLYDVPHRLTWDVQAPALEVGWMQADADGRYHGFHYSTLDPFAESGRSRTAQVMSMHIVCPDLGRWAAPLFSHLPHVRQVTISLYPKGNWDLEAAKIERVLRIVLQACSQLESLQIVLCHTVTAAGSRSVRMTRSIPVSHAVRAIDDDRISLKTSDFLFDKYGRSPSDEVVQFTRLQWQARQAGRAGPWLR